MKLTCVGAAVVCLLSGLLLGLAMPRSSADVDSFNSGFMDGICAPEIRPDGSQVWEDGSGRLCVGP